MNRAAAAAAAIFVQAAPLTFDTCGPWSSPTRNSKAPLHRTHSHFHLQWQSLAWQERPGRVDHQYLDFTTSTSTSNINIHILIHTLSQLRPHSSFLHLLQLHVQPVPHPLDSHICSPATPSTRQQLHHQSGVEQKSYSNLSMTVASVCPSLLFGFRNMMFRFCCIVSDM